MKILAIESSCDETAAAIIGDDAIIINNVVVSQVDIFAAYGGVIPEVAARSHLEAILPVIHKALDDAHLTKDDIDYIAVTYAPGLLGSLLIGTLTARTLAILWHKPLYAVHHLKSHIYANWLSTPSANLNNQSSNQSTTQINNPRASQINNPRASATLPFLSQERSGKGEQYAPASQNALFGESPELTSAQSQESSEERACSFFRDDARLLATASDEDAPHPQRRAGATSCPKKECFEKIQNSSTPPFPLLSLVISGGHTQIIYMPAHNQFHIIGTTRDDAVGECFDKVAKVLGLPYPGGPSIAQAAQHGDPTKYSLPHPKIDGLDFSFSGLKTAVLRAVQSACNLPITTPSYELSSHLTSQQKSDFAASFQSTACDILLEKLQLAYQQHPDVKSIVFAGGVSANQVLRDKAYTTFPNLPIFFPELKFTGDNAAMVGAAAYYEILSGVSPVDPYHLDILPRTPIK